MATHAARCSPPLFHPDVLAYGKDKLIQVPNVLPVDVPPDNGKGYINGFIHLQIPEVSRIMNELIQPTEFMLNTVNKYQEQLHGCVAGFHARRGLSSEDSKHFAFHPFASQTAIDAMVKEANKLDDPVYFLSDSVSTKKYFKTRVPLARCLDIDIGFTADEHSQKVEVQDENFANKVNSMAEWFLLSRMPRVYMTAGGINDRNVDGEVEEGITSTFGYSAALYGGKIPYYVFNDGHIHLPDGKGETGKRYLWSDMLI
jgi:hypothetical protein